MKEMISSKQIITLILLFVFGTSVVIGVGFDAHQDSWMSLIAAIILSVPLLLMYARTIMLFPGKGLFDIIELLFSKKTGKVLMAIMIWYFLFLGGLVLHNFFEFISITTLPKTPKILIMIIMVLVVVYLGRSNISVLGKWGIVVSITIISVVILTILFSIGNIDFSNLLPVFEHRPITILNGAIKLIVFPFAELVTILPLASFFKKGTNSYKVFMYGLILSGLLLFIVQMRNLLTIGFPLMEYSFFSSYTIARIIEVGDFLSRIEGAITINLLFAVITKTTICLIAATKGTSKLFNTNNYKNLIMPVGLILIMLSVIVYQSIFEMEEFKEKYLVIYSIPFQFAIPFIIWITAEVKKKRIKEVN
ncbi:MAG TPA: endospore germination permease [Mollicutes bacterium]|nr:endospore germination permease [Mollicutes bacterium]